MRVKNNGAVEVAKLTAGMVAQILKEFAQELDKAHIHLENEARDVFLKIVYKTILKGITTGMMVNDMFDAVGGVQVEDDKKEEK